MSITTVVPRRRMLKLRASLVLELGGRGGGTFRGTVITASEGELLIGSLPESGTRDGTTDADAGTDATSGERFR